jgi:hypothetical protein
MYRLQNKVSSDIQKVINSVIDCRTR